MQTCGNALTFLSFNNFQFLAKNVIFFKWPYRLTVRTEPSQGLNRGSIPRRVTLFISSYPPLS
jgi:hypothetical protein